MNYMLMDYNMPAMSLPNVSVIGHFSLKQKHQNITAVVSFDVLM